MSQILPFPRERVSGRRIVLETRVYQFEPRPQPVAIPPAAMPLVAWWAWSIVFTALCVAVWGR
jgi:hypothetical protein